eukprot:GHVS01032033.1.p1 GENE.GHVS01032033.1~~GHVS01032033.1.p1  ORF type:complete len:595 (-),score=84.77 GHVS01032033.1:357-2045(-)
MSELIGAHRKKSYKKSFEPHAAAQKRHSAMESVRKDERLRTFSLRRRLAGEQEEEGAKHDMDVKSMVSGLCACAHISLEGWRQLRKAIQIGGEQTLKDAGEAGVVRLLENVLNLGPNSFLDDKGTCCREEVLCEVVWTVGLLAAEEQLEGVIVCDHNVMFSRVCSLFIDNTSNRRLSLLCCLALGNLCADPQLELGAAVLRRTLTDMQAVAEEAASSRDSAGLLRALVFMLCNAVRDGSLREHLDPEAAAKALKAVVQHHQTAVKLSARDDRRGALGEGLWCIAYLTTEQRFCDSFHACQLYPLLIRLLSPLSSSSSSGLTPPRSPPSSETTELLLLSHNSMFYMSDDSLQQIEYTHVDSIVPAIKIFDNGSEYYMDVILGLPEFTSVLSRLTNNTHRGIRLDSVSLIAKIASKNKIPAVLPVLQRMAEVLNSSEAYDIRREAAWYLLSVTFSDGLLHLNDVMKLNVVEGMLSLLDKAKFDKNSVMICLDFLEGVMMFSKGGRRLLFDQNAIEVMESAQFIHDDVIERRIAWMVENYFEDLDADVCDVSAADEELHGQTSFH